MHCISDLIGDETIYKLRGKGRQFISMVHCSSLVGMFIDALPLGKEDIDTTSLAKEPLNSSILGKENMDGLYLVQMIRRIKNQFVLIILYLYSINSKWPSALKDHLGGYKQNLKTCINTNVNSLNQRNKNLRNFEITDDHFQNSFLPKVKAVFLDNGLDHFCKYIRIDYTPYEIMMIMYVSYTKGKIITKDIPTLPHQDWMHDSLKSFITDGKLENCPSTFLHNESSRSPFDQGLFGFQTFLIGLQKGNLNDFMKDDMNLLIRHIWEECESDRILDQNTNQNIQHNNELIQKKKKTKSNRKRKRTKSMGRSGGKISSSRNDQNPTKGRRRRVQFCKNDNNDSDSSDSDSSEEDDCTDNRIDSINNDEREHPKESERLDQIEYQKHDIQRKEDADIEGFQEEITKQSQDKEVIDDEESKEELTHLSEHKEDMTDDKESHDDIANETNTLHKGEDATRGESINILSSEMSYFELYNHIENICTTINMSNITASDVKQKIENELSIQLDTQQRNFLDKRVIQLMEIYNLKCRVNELEAMLQEDRNRRTPIAFMQYRGSGFKKNSSSKSGEEE